MNLNTLKDFPHTKYYYLTHPWKWVKHLFYNIRDFWNRGTKGYTYRDVCNFDDWFCSVVPLMLRDMADYGSAYPGREPFDTPEKWHKWLYEMAQTIENIQIDTWFDNNNEYAEKYYQSLENELYEQNHPHDPHITFSNQLPYEKISKLYYKKMKELAATRQQVLEDFGRIFFQYFDIYWD